MSQCQHQNEVLIAKINRGEKIVASILKFCQQNKINGAWVCGIGAISEIKLALYNLDKKNYSKKRLTGPFEIASLSGNVGLLKSKHVAHLH